MLNKKLLLASICALSLMAKAQTVSLFAGAPHLTDFDWHSYSGNTNSIPATSDSFALPWGIVNDTTGKWWISDLTKMYIVSGSSSIVRGGFTGSPMSPGAEDYINATGTNSRFSQPHGICVHPKTNDVYLCDFGNNVIRKGLKFVNISNPSVWSNFAGVQSFLIGGYKDGAVGTAKFNAPEDIVVTSDGGTFYVSDQANHCIRKINGGNVTTVAGDTIDGDKLGIGKAARFSYPSGLFLENDNSLLVCDRNNSKIKRINLTTGEVTLVVSGLFAPTDVVNLFGLLYITDHNSIRTWDGSKLKLYAGKYGVEGYSNGKDSSARFRGLALMCYDKKSQSLYVADNGNNCFRKVSVIATPTADFWANKTNATVGEIVTLHNSGKNGTSFLWTITPGTYTLENGSKLTDSVLYVSFSAVNSYSVTLKATNPAGSDTKLKSSYINVSVISGLKPTTDFIANKTSVLLTDTVSFIEQSGNSPTSWSWTITPATFTYLSGTTSTSRFPKVKFTASGKYTIKLTATNANGDVDKIRTDYITVAANSVNALHTLPVNIYPNPASQTIQLGVRPKGSILVTGINGITQNFETNNAMADISKLAAGIYFVRFENVSGEVFVGKFVKIKD